MYTHLARFYNKLGWDKFSKSLATKLKPFLKKWGVQTHYDLACGTGVFVNGITKLGINSSGSDISKEMIKIAKSNYSFLDFEIKDMTNFRLKKPVDFITCIYDSVNHLLRFKEWEAMFKSVFNNLNNSGKFLFDINTLKKINNVNSINCTSKDKYVLIQKTNSVRENKCIFNIEWFWKSKNGLYRRYQERVKETSFPYKKIKKSLKKIGFKNIKILFTENKNSNRERFYLLATK